MNINQLILAIDQNLAEIELQIAAVMQEAEEAGVSPWKLKYADGQFVLAPLLTAKSHLLHGLVVMRDIST